MATVIVLGGSGAVGRVAARTLAACGAFEQVVIGDIDTARAEEVRVWIGRPGVSVTRVDAGDTASVAAAIRGVDLVVNCVGPFYRFGPPVLRAALAERKDYVDVCDDVDATRALLELDGAAKAAGVRAVVGLGNSPGVTNLLARFAHDQLLDEVEAVDIYHAHGGEPFEGPGVVAHRMHGMTMDIPMFLDGALRTVRFFDPDGLALRDRTDFHVVGRDVPVYPYPHPEQLTIPQHLRVRRVTNRGTVLPDEYFRLTTEVVRLGLAATEPVDVGGRSVEPREFAIAWLLRRRDELLRATAFGTQRGCTKVEVSGLRRGKPRRYVFSLSSTDQALGEGTGIPVAIGAILLKDGCVKTAGVLPPEAACDPLEFLVRVKPVLASLGPGGSFEGVVVEQVDEAGQMTRVDLPF